MAPKHVICKRVRAYHHVPAYTRASVPCQTCRADVPACRPGMPCRATKACRHAFAACRACRKSVPARSARYPPPPAIATVRQRARVVQDHRVGAVARREVAGPVPQDRLVEQAARSALSSPMAGADPSWSSSGRTGRRRLRRASSANRTTPGVLAAPLVAMSAVAARAQGTEPAKPVKISA